MNTLWQRILFVLIFLLAGNLIAGNTGKIAGTVIDANTGEPVPGANIILSGTYYGASSDINGEFFIINIPPGKYDVECIVIGYQKTIMKNVLVQSDQTTMLNFRIKEQTLDLDEAIEVVAERAMVQKDLTSSKKVTTAEEIKSIPAETFTQVLATQAGVTRGADGALHIRGGRSNEIAYLVDGVSVANPYNTNGLGTSVANNAIQELTVVSGAFNAEYGNAMSGVVNITTKDGGKKFEGSLTGYTGDYVSAHDDIFLNIDQVKPFSNKTIEGTLSGPIPIARDKVTFFFSGKYTDSEGYLYGVREHDPADSANFQGRIEEYFVETEEKVFERRERFIDEWYIERGGDGKIVPMNPSWSYNMLGKLKINLTPSLVLRIESIYNRSWWKQYTHDYKYNPDGDYQYNSRSYHHAVKLTHSLSPSTYYELRLAYNQRKYQEYVYENPYDPRYVPTDKIVGSPGGRTFVFGGTRMDHVHQKSKSYISKFDITSQINNRHQVKTGFEWRLHRLQNETFTILYDRINYNSPTVLGLDSPTHDYYDRWPEEFSAYIQDKIEYESMIINVGVRYDYFNAKSKYAKDLLHPDGELADATPKHMVSPRLGVSFPITAKGIIHFSYGHFSQMPAFSALYVNPDFELPKSGVPTFGNANLRPQKTVMYEMGLQQQLTNDIAINITGFYRDIRDLLTRQRIKFQSREGDLRDYRVYVNQDYGNVKGITLSLKKKITKQTPVGFSLDYTYQVAEGNDNDTDAFFYNSLSGLATIKEIVPLDWDQPHNLYAVVTVAPSDRFTTSIIGKISSGYPYSPFIYNKDFNYDIKPNSDRKPLQRYVDIQSSYRFTVGGYHVTFFTKIYNLFDTLNERYVYDDTGRATYTFANRSQEETDTLIKHYGEPGVHEWTDYINRPHYYTAPREVRLGVTVEF
ncbi:TonB-dependent receptor [Caldithrix abyssi]